MAKFVRNGHIVAMWRTEGSESELLAPGELGNHRGPKEKEMTTTRPQSKTKRREDKW